MSKAKVSKVKMFHLGERHDGKVRNMCRRLNLTGHVTISPDDPDAKDRYDDARKEGMICDQCDAVIEGYALGIQHGVQMSAEQMLNKALNMQMDRVAGETAH